jgi:MAPEG family
MTVPVITTFYSSVLVFLLAWAQWRAWNFAKSLRIPLVHRPEIAGDTLTALLLLLLAEQLGAPTIWLHGCALVLVVARVIHIHSLVRNLGKWSGPSMPALGATWVVILLLAITNALLVLVTLFTSEKSFTSF